MPHFQPNVVERLTRDLRRWRILAFALLVAMIGMGLFSAYLVRQLDRNYSLLIDRTLPLIDDIRSVARDQSTVFRAIVTGLVENDPAQVAGAVREAQDALEHMRRGEAVLLASDILHERAGLLAQQKKADDAFTSVATDLLTRISTNVTAEAERERLERLRASLEQANATSREMIRFVEDRSQSISDDYSRLARTRAAILFGIAGLPVIMGTLVLIVIGCVIGAMIILFRRVGVEDQR